MRDDVLVAISIYIAYKWLTDDGEHNIVYWVTVLKISKKRLFSIVKEWLGNLSTTYRLKAMSGTKREAEELEEYIPKKVAQPIHPPVQKGLYGLA